MRRGWTIAGACVAALALFVVIDNASMLAPPGRGKPLLLAHRGVAQTFSVVGLSINGCSATRIDPPRNAFLENTIPSMIEAFRLGVDIVELDVHATTDRQFAVFHDWTVDCRTDGHGETDMHSMRYLKTLDIGYGYTADGGKSFPFRGKAVGMMPSLDEVLAHFPGRRFLINIKSNDRTEGVLLAARLARMTPAERARLMVYGGGDRPLDELRRRLPDLVVMSEAQEKACALRYIALGWTGYMPQACRHTMIVVPLNYTWLAWGWPNRMIQRFQDAGSPVFAAAPYTGQVGLAGIDTKAQLDLLPEDYAGGIWTNEIGVIGALVRQRR